MVPHPLIRVSIVPIVCTGDCNEDVVVGADEMIVGISTALGHKTVSGCPAFDGNHDNKVTVSELLAAVINARRGCP